MDYIPIIAFPLIILSLVSLAILKYWPNIMRLFAKLTAYRINGEKYRVVLYDEASAIWSECMRQKPYGKRTDNMTVGDFEKLVSGEMPVLQKYYYYLSPIPGVHSERTSKDMLIWYCLPKDTAAAYDIAKEFKSLKIPFPRNIKRLDFLSRDGKSYHSIFREVNDAGCVELELSYRSGDHSTLSAAFIERLL
jgi:hypothetical protein